ncbi:DUF6438 domain-containing protein [uncultured Flavobacterium sp.]|uniref:DUF6438 domain-containing protein n=1 Tax=uncultured Flavobacterium sp. TaxID=165435 RepID=UPI0025CF1507|nr:DUF6438 domain-containing protein [uncultured Flavobacterium sp.]
MKFITTLILILTLVSCKQKSKNDYESKIIGEWKYVKELEKPNKNGNIPPPPPPPFGSQEVGYDFNNDGTFDYKLGFFKYIKGDENHQSQNVYLGNTSNYKIENDSLKLYDLSTKKWDSYKIASIKFDTLKIINSEGKIDKFHKLNYQLDNSKSFDKIIISSTGCYGRCPVTDIEINKSGHVIFKGGYCSSIKGNYKSKISKELFSKINLSFLKSNWTSLENEYISSWTDDETVYVTFVKNGTIIKTIEDYGGKAPTEFIWAYTPIRYLQQNIKLEKNAIDTTLFDFNYIGFKKKDVICSLTKSESFYLKNLLSKSSITEKSFIEKYTIEYWSNDIKKKIVTDGRYYKLEKNKGEFIILDLKYDFLKQNNLVQRFRKVTEYD